MTREELAGYGVIFLDIDGVLVNAASLPRGTEAMDDRCVEVLDSFMVRHREARIVISSTWRFAHTLREIRAVMARHGFKFGDRIIGTTTTKQHFNGRLYVSRPRGLEIDDWLGTHGRPAWIIVLDDERDVEPLGSYHVQPKFETGLTRDHLPLMERMVAWQMAAVRIEEADRV